MSQLLLLISLSPQPTLTICNNSNNNINNWAHLHCLPRQLHLPSRTAPLPTFMHTYPSKHANNTSNNNTTRSSTCSQRCIKTLNINNYHIQLTFKRTPPPLTHSLLQVRCTLTSSSTTTNNSNSITITILTITPIKCTGWTTTAQESGAEDDHLCRPFI